MRRVTVSLPSPAMVVALIALFAALGGSAYAAKKISSKQIRTGSVGTRAVKNRSLTSLDLRRDSLGGATIREERLNASKIDARRLKTVPRANSVPKNSVGASDLGPVTRRFGGPATVANGGVGKPGADCKKGELVLGGGGRWADSVPGESIQSSYADSDTAWTAIGFNASGAPRRFQAFAMCLAP
ncbi:MAG: hypothetical protein ACR2J6_03440 [Thermoleophilaceae bacterium]